MNYQEFLFNIESRMHALLGEDVSITIQKFDKNNGVRLDGMIIQNANSNITPTIYLQPYYHRYLDGISLEEICKDIHTTYLTHLPNADFDISAFTDFSKARSNITLRLINYERNAKLLTQVPHKRYQDLAVVFCCLLENYDEELGSILIRNEHLSLWDADCDLLYELALNNTPRLLPATCDNMLEILKDLPEMDNCENFSPNIPMYILTNSRRTNGAGTILYPHLLFLIADELSSGFYILPSSVHEVLIIPDTYITDPDTLVNMVQQVNDTQIADDELLSYHIYHYHEDTDELTMYISSKQNCYS